jgi:uncharacterized repeat protein (TIGR01451 family)
MQLLKKHFLLILLSFSCLVSQAQYELPSAVPPFPGFSQTIKIGSLIIPMDTTSQKVPGYFNLKAYGLVNYLLQNEVPVKWAIRTGKSTKTGPGSIDYTVMVNRVFPDTTANASIAFRGGPFIIDSGWVGTALPFIAAYEASNGNNINIYKVNTAFSADIRYTLTFKPKIGLLNHNGYDTITVSILNEAGFNAANYQIFSPANQVFNSSSKFSLVSDAHYANGDTTHINPVLRYVNLGGNLIASCAGQGSYENSSLTFTTAGIDTIPAASPGSVTSPIYSNLAMPITQFDGTLITPNGEYKYWFLKTGSSFRSTAYQLFRYLSTVSPFPQLIVLAGSKIKPVAEKGGNIYYLGGHDYNFYGTGSKNENAKINGRRIWLNAVFIPPHDTMELDFTTDVELTLVAAGLAVKNETLELDIIVTNKKGGTAKNVNVQINLPAGLSYSSHTCGIGSFNSGTGTWTIGSLAKNVSDTLHLLVDVTQLGAMTVSGSASNIALETILPNNSATLNLFGVSRPVAVNDTVIFLGPYAVDKNTRANDSDEDGGPFGNVSVVAGPFHGSITIIGTDTIRYVPFASYLGPDSLLYVTCDNYPLCDTAWLFIDVVNALPVELSHFSGVRKEGSVKLRWTTSSEKENDFFAVERSDDGKSFQDRGHVKGKGNSSEENQYIFNDPDNNSPVLYYRLRQVDWNGSEHISQTIALTLKNDGNLTVTIFPNPVGSGNDLVVNSQNIKGESVLEIHDIMGRCIFSKALEKSEGQSMEIISSTGLLHSGCYIVTLTSETETFSARLIVK